MTNHPAPFPRTTRFRTDCRPLPSQFGRDSGLTRTSIARGLGGSDRLLVAQMDAEGFGHCTNHYECGAACPKEISINFIARMNADFLKTAVTANAPLKQREGQ